MPRRTPPGPGTRSVPLNTEIESLTGSQRRLPPRQPRSPRTRPEAGALDVLRPVGLPALLQILLDFLCGTADEPRYLLLDEGSNLIDKPLALLVVVGGLGRRDQGERGCRSALLNVDQDA